MLRRSWLNDRKPNIIMIEEQTIDAFEEFEAYRLLANCSHNSFNINLCSFTQPSEIGFSTMELIELAACTVFYLAIVLFGIVCNCFVLLVAIMKKLRRKSALTVTLRAFSTVSRVEGSSTCTPETNMASSVVLDDTLICLCISDLLVILICIPIRLARWFTYTWTFGEFLCKTVFYLQYWCGVFSVMTIVFLSLQRYYAAAHPLTIRSMWTASRVRLTLVLICLVSAIFTLPVLFGQIHRPIANTGYYWCVTEFYSELQLIVFEVYMFFLLVVAPLAVMITVYACILRKIPRQSVTITLRAARRQQDKQQTSVTAAAIQEDDIQPQMEDSLMISSTMDNRRQYVRVVQMLSTAILGFAICWTPYQTDRLLSTLGVIVQFNVGWMKPFRMTTTLLALSNASLNPLIYCFLSTHFRKTVKNLFTRRKA